MKKYYYSLFAAVSLLLAVTSCSQEEDFPKSSNGVTSFSISLNDKAGSRADGESIIGQGTMVDKLYYQVFMKNNDGYVKVTEVLKEDFPSEQNVDIPLLNGETYSIVFWAQDTDCTIYDLTDLSAIKVKYNNGVVANQESYDAFYKALVDFEADGKTHRVELRRPFAQLNLGTSDWTKVIVPDGAAPVTETKVTVKGLADTFNPLSGKATVSQTNIEATFDYSSIPTRTVNDGTKDVEVNEVFKVDGNDYTYLSLNYLLVPSQTNNEKALVDLTFGLKNETRELQSISVTNVPLERNYRTNIIGALLTGTDFDIIIDANPEGTEKVEVAKVSNQDEIQEAINNAEDGTPTYLEVTGNITFGESRALSRATETSYISVPAGKNVVLDLNGFIISGIDNSTGSFALIQNNGTLTITNSGEQEGKLEFRATHDRDWNAYSSVVSNNPGGNLTVESGVTIEHKGGTDMAYGIDNLTNGKGTVAVTTINGATVKSTYRAIRQFLNGVEATNELYVKSGTIEGTNKSIWMQDPNANANTGKLVVESEAQLKGDVYLFVTAGSTEWPVEVSIAASALQDKSTVVSGNVPEGYLVAENDGIWTVLDLIAEDGTYQIANLAALKWFAAEVSAKNTFEGKTVNLTADIDLKNEHWIPIGNENLAGETFNGTFEGNGYTISNLKHHFDGEQYFVGLFGCLDNATVQNLTITNVDIKLSGAETWGHIGTVAGWAQGTSLLQDITVNGTVKIEGEMSVEGSHRIGGVLGGNQGGNVSLKNIVVNADKDSYVKGSSAVGGVVGQLQEQDSYENVQSNINVTANVFAAGGIVGIASAKGTFTNCSTTGNVALNSPKTENNPYHLGGIAGSWADAADATLTLTDCSFTGKLTSGEIAAFDCGDLVGRGYSANVDATVSIDDVKYVYKGNGIYLVDKTYEVKTAAGLVALSGMTIEGGQSVKLMADIDLTGVEFNGLTAFNPENNNTFDGQNFTVSNWTYTGGASDMGFIKNWVGPIKNVKFDNCSLKTGGRSAVVAAKVYGNIENVTVNKCSVEDSYWACGIVAGLYNGGSISNCTVTESSVKSNGGTGGIVGVINETGGERALTNCSVSNSTINNTGIYGAGYSGGGLVGMFNADKATYKIENCKVESNKLEGDHIFETYPTIAAASLDEPIK